MKKNFFLLCTPILMALSVVGCMASAGPPPVEYGYEPMLYDGYVVYFTDEGIPYYWYGGVRVWVPESQRDQYTNRWRENPDTYRQWHTHRERTYRDYRYREPNREERGEERSHFDDRHKDERHESDERR
jgi:hypothetical protein